MTSKIIRKYLLAVLIAVQSYGVGFAVCVETSAGVYGCDTPPGFEAVADALSGEYLEKTGSGEALFTAANTISSSVVISGGALAINNPAALGGAYDLYINSAVFKTGGPVVLSNNIFVSSGTINTASSQLTLNGNINGDSLEKTGEGTLILNGTNNITNADISGGLLYLASQNNLNGNITLSSSGTLRGPDSLTLNNNFTFNGGSIYVDYDEIIDGYGLVLTGMLDGTLLNKEGSGLLTLDGAGYGGNININDGGVAVNTETFASSYTGTIRMAGEESFLLMEQDTDGVFGGNTEGGVFIKDGSGTVVLTGRNTAEAVLYDGAFSISTDGNLSGDIAFEGGELIVSGAVTLGGGAAQNIYFDNDISAQRNINVSAGAALTFSSGVILNGSGTLVKDGAGKLTLNHNYSSNNYLGNTLIKSGVLEIFDGEALGIKGSVLMMQNGELLVSSSTALNREISSQFSYSSVINTAGGVDFELLMGTRGMGKFVKEGAGTLVLTSGDLLHTGGTLISSGTLRGAGERMGSGSITNNSVLIFDQAADGVFNAALSGGGTVNKEGSGTLTINGFLNSDINILEGAVKGTSQTLLGGFITSSGTAVIFDQGFNGGYGGSISGEGGLIKEGLGLLTLTGVNSYAGDTIIKGVEVAEDQPRAQGIEFSSDAALGAAGGKIILDSGHLQLAAGSVVTTGRDIELQGWGNTVTVSSGAVYTVNGEISGSSLVKNGAGELILTGTNTYVGGTQVSSGTLSVYEDSALGDGYLVLGGGSFKALDDLDLARNVLALGIAGMDTASGKTLTVSGIIYGGGTINKKGAGTLLLDGYSIHTGGFKIDEGVLIGDASSIQGDIELTGGELIFDQADEGYYAGNITASSSATITKSGAGFLLMSGDSENGNILSVGNLNVKEGSLITTGILNGTVNISSGTLFAMAESGGGVISASGVFAADDLEFDGEINIKDGGALNLLAKEGELNTLSIKNTVSGLGNLNIESGAGLEISAEGVFAAPAYFSVIEYDGLLSGVFDTVTVVNSNRLLAEAFYNPDNTVSVLISRILSNYSGLGGLSRNQKQIAAALDRASAAPGQDMEFILDTIDNAASPAEQAAALTQAAGLIYANTVGINSFNLMKENAYLRVNSPGVEGPMTRNIWARGIGFYGDIKANEHSEKLYNFSSGFAGGLDKYYSDAGLRAGLMLSYVRHDLKHNGKENLNGDEYQLGVYALAEKGAFNINGALSLGYRDSTVERQITFLGRRASSRPKSFSLNLDGEAALSSWRAGSFEVRPFAGITAGAERRNSFNEKDAGDADISFDGDFAFYAVARGGIGLQKKGKTFSWYTDLSLRQNIFSPETELIVYSQKYSLKPAEQKTFYGARAGGVKYLSDLVSVYADVNADFNDTAKNIYLNIGLRSYW